MQTLADGVTVRRAVDEGEPRRAVVVGGGYVGLEMAEALVRRGLEVALVDRTEQPMASTLDLDMGELVADAVRAVGVSLHLGEAVDGFEAENGTVRAVHTANRSFPADIVVLGLGVRPNVALARDAGIAIGDKGGIVTDARMETSVGGVWAAGDCVESMDRITGLPRRRRTRHPCQQAGTRRGDQRHRRRRAISRRGRHCGLEDLRRTRSPASASPNARPPTSTATWSAVTIESTSRAGYYPGAAPIKVKVVAERPGGRLLGAQIVGAEGAAKRIDVLATAIWNRMTVDDVASLDLGVRAAVLTRVGPGARGGPQGGRRARLTSGAVEAPARSFLDRRRKLRLCSGGRQSRRLRGRRSEPPPAAAASAYRWEAAARACSSLRSFSYIICTSSSNVTVAASRAARRALVASPMRRSTSAGRMKRSSCCTNGAQSSKPATLERDVEQLADGVRLARGDHVVARLGLLEHQPHRLDVVAGVAPVARRVEVAEA